MIEGSTVGPIVFDAEWSGKIPSVNKWKDIRVRGQRAHMYMSTAYRQAKETMGFLFASRHRSAPIDYRVDCQIIISLWKMRDSDSPVKLIFDALEAGGVVKNDRLIRNFSVIRHDSQRDEPNELTVILYAVE